VGIEGGIEVEGEEMHAFAWIYIQSKDMVGKSRTGTFLLPKKVTELVKQGKELGMANDIIFKKNNSKQKSGAVGILTDDLIDRTSYYTEAVILALIPFKNSELY
jgi:non-canonical (house-cleaning) NTP pyrophosphatase